jgi:hypothetical protein
MQEALGAGTSREGASMMWIGIAWLVSTAVLMGLATYAPTYD